MCRNGRNVISSIYRPFWKVSRNWRNLISPIYRPFWKVSRNGRNVISTIYRHFWKVHILLLAVLFCSCSVVVLWLFCNWGIMREIFEIFISKCGLTGSLAINHSLWHKINRNANWDTDTNTKLFSNRNTKHSMWKRGWGGSTASNLSLWERTEQTDARSDMCTFPQTQSLKYKFKYSNKYK